VTEYARREQSALNIEYSAFHRELLRLVAQSRHVHSISVQLLVRASVYI